MSVKRNTKQLSMHFEVEYILNSIWLYNLTEMLKMS